MASLLDTVKQNSSALAAPTPASNPLLSATGLQPTVGEATQGTAQIAAVGQTGKSLDQAAGLNTRLSSLGERLASVQALNQAKDVAKEAQLQGVSLDQQQDALAQQFNQQNIQISENRIEAQEKFNIQMKGMMFEYTNNLKSLNLQKDKSRMEQVGFMLRLGSQEYQDKLQLEGRKARLDSSVAFGEELQRTIFSQELDLFSDSLEFRNYMMADARESQKQLADMDIEFAMQVAMSDNKAASGQMMWSGVGTALGAGLSYAAANKTPAAVAQTSGAPLASAQNAAPRLSPNLGSVTGQQGGLLEGVPFTSASEAPYTPPGGG
jgi:hypothetical protein